MFRFLKSLLGRDRYDPGGPWLSHIDEHGFWVKGALSAAEPRDPVRLQKIWIITNGLGPFSDDIFWRFEHPDGDFFFPVSADSTGEMLSYFQDLKGFDNEAVIEAMASVEDNEFLAWDRSTVD